MTSETHTKKQNQIKNEHTPRNVYCLKQFIIIQ